MAQGSTSDKAKEALKALIAEKKVTLQPIWLEEELDGAGLVFASGEGSCHETCSKGGQDWMCTPEWFEYLNQCSVLRASFPAASNCLTHLYGRDLPAFGEDLGSLRGSYVMINAKFAQYQSGCDAVGDHSVRLCACRKRVVKNEDKDMNARVSKMVVRQLRELDLRVKAGRDQSSKGVHGHLNEFWAAHEPLDLIDDIKSKRNTFVEATRGQTCFDACQACETHLIPRSPARDPPPPSPLRLPSADQNLGRVPGVSSL